MIEVIGLQDIRKVMSWPAAVESIQACLTALAAGTMLQPPPVELRHPQQGELHVKCGFAIESEWIVVKAATGGFNGAPPSGCFVLIDANTGRPRYLLEDEGWLTQVRTAAAGVLANLMFARPEARSLLILGTGSLAPLLLEAHRAVMPHLAITVWGRDRAARQQFGAKHGVFTAEDLESVVTSTDILVTATSSRAPLIEDAWVSPGTHVTALGADTRGKQELPPALLRRADLLVCDDVAAAAYAGELQNAEEEVRGRAVSWPELLNPPYVRADTWITIADLCGIGAEDAAIAAQIVGAGRP